MPDKINTENMTEDEIKIIEQYQTCFDAVRELCDSMKAQGIGPGVTSVVLVRMSAMINRAHGEERKEFQEFAGDHYDMVVSTCDREDEEELN